MKKDAPLAGCVMARWEDPYVLPSYAPLSGCKKRQNQPYNAHLLGCFAVEEKIFGKSLFAPRRGA